MPSAHEWLRRAATVVVCAPLALYALQSPFLTFILLVSLQTVALYEFETNICARILSKSSFVLPFLGIFISTSTWISSSASIAAVSTFIAYLILLAVELFPFIGSPAAPVPRDLLLRLCLSFFGLFQIISGFTHALLVRFIPQYGLGLQILMVLTMWNTDNGALLLGSLCGKHRFIPSISPKKTLEGVIGGLALSSLTTWLLWHPSQTYFLLPALSTTKAIGFGIVLGVAGIAGDLIESLLKRIAMVKDSGQFFPGHGGCFDRMDSMLFIAPIVYYWYYIIVI